MGNLDFGFVELEDQENFYAYFRSKFGFTSLEFKQRVLLYAEQFKILNFYQLMQKSVEYEYDKFKLNKEILGSSEVYIDYDVA
jgi:hypothetical protein